MFRHVLTIIKDEHFIQKYVFNYYYYFIKNLNKNTKQ